MVATLGIEPRRPKTSYYQETRFPTKAHVRSLTVSSKGLAPVHPQPVTILTHNKLFGPCLEVSAHVRFSDALPLSYVAIVKFNNC